MALSLIFNVILKVKFEVKGQGIRFRQRMYQNGLKCRPLLAAYTTMTFNLAFELQCQTQSQMTGCRKSAQN